MKFANHTPSWPFGPDPAKLLDAETVPAGDVTPQFAWRQDHAVAPAECTGLTAAMARRLFG